MTDKILLMGPQASGKGTQAEKLAANLRIPAFGMGQLLRDEIASGSDLGLTLEAIVKRGDLVGDQEAAQVLKRRLAKPDTRDGYILDGYPRNLTQLAQFTFDTPTHVIVIDLPRGESLRRLGGRLTCRACGKVGAVKDRLNPGDHCACGGEWYQRDDDTQEAIQRRLEIYEKDTSPVIEKYDGLVKHVDGMGSVEEVFGRILRVLRNS